MKENKQKLISLREATKYCDYSQGYLNLLVRSGKLKAIKIGKNWAIKLKWLDKYLAKIKKKA
jgi:excisionase family DNA binding protein